MVEIMCCSGKDTQEVSLEIPYGNLRYILDMPAWWYQFHLNLVFIMYYCFQGL